MPAPSRITIHGNEIAYRDVGEGEVIVLIHGMAGSSATWRHVMPALGRQHRVIAPDMLGHGESAKPRSDYSLGALASTVRDLLIALDVERATIVGQSLGGGVAMQMAYQHPEWVDRLVLVSSGGLGPDVSVLLRLLSTPASDLVLRVAAPWFVLQGGDAVRRWLGARGISAQRADEMWRAYASLGDAETRRAFLRTLRSVVDMGGQAVSARNRLYLAEAVPTMVVWGEADTIIPVSHAHAAHEAMPQSRLELIPGIGHFPQVEAPQRFVDLMVDFMQTTDAARIDPASLRDRLKLAPEQSAG